MPGPVSFTSHYSDESNDNGFQWKFRCGRCSTEYRSSYKQNMFSRGRGVLRAMRDMFGDRIEVLGKASSAAESYSNTWGASASSGKDKAFAAAVDEVGQEFRQCGGCGSWVCEPVCWNEHVGQCTRCSPEVAHQIARAQASARDDQIRAAARNQNWTENLDIATPARVHCPTCGAMSTGGRFCSACGGAFAAASDCAGCGHPIAVGAIFCSNCGRAH